MYEQCCWGVIKSWHLSHEKASFLWCRAVVRSENPGGLVVLSGDNVSPLVQIGLTDLAKTGGAKAPPASPLALALEKQLTSPT